MTTQISVVEWDTSDRIPLSKDDVNYIQHRINRDKNNSRIEVIPDNGEFRIRAKSWVGAFGLPSGRSVYVEPWITEINFLRMLAYVLNIKWKPFELEAYAKPGSHLPEIIAAILTSRIQMIFLSGFHKSYQVIQNPTSFIRGRILLTQQVRHFSQPGMTYCEYDELTADTIENRCLLFSAHILRRVIRNVQLRQDIESIIATLQNEGVNLVPVPLEQVDLALNGLTRLNWHYETALAICRFVVQNTWIDRLGETGEIPIFGMLLSSHQLFQEFIVKLLRGAFPDYEIRPQERVGRLLRRPAAVLSMSLTQNLIPDIKIQPDVVLCMNHSPLLIVDAKYKPSVSRIDIFEAVSYSLALKVPVVLVFPEDAAEVMGCYEVIPNPESRIFIVTIDVRKQVDDYVPAVMQQLGERVSRIIEGQ